jgi:farnesyl-diphosphate farnesyltransferase
VALRDSLARTGVTPRHATDLLTAFRQDVTKHRYATIDELYEYCRYSANPVGRYVLDVHGEPERTHAPSDALCTSLQVLNHMQDCGRDLAQLDRCYLPQMLLDHFGAELADLTHRQATPELRRVFNALLDRIDRLNHAAEDLPRTVRDRRLRVETALIVQLARRLARRLSRQDPLAMRVKLRKSDAVLSILSSLAWLL